MSERDEGRVWAIVRDACMEAIDRNADAMTFAEVSAWVDDIARRAEVKLRSLAVSPASEEGTDR